MKRNSTQSLKPHVLIGATVITLGLVLFGTASVAEQAGAGGGAAAVKYTNFVTVETVGNQVACGKTAKNVTECTGSGAGYVNIPSTVGDIKRAYINTLFSCVEDQDGLKCVRVPSDNTYTINGMTPKEAITTLITESVPGSIKIANYSACGVDSASGDLVCHFPYFYSTPSHYVRLTAGKKLTAYAVNDVMVCMADGDVISCRDDNDNIRSTATLPDMKELVVTDNSFCARSATEAKCWNKTTFVDTALPAEFLTAPVWRTDGGTICAITTDNRLTCVDSLTMAAPPWGTGWWTPPEFQIPNGTDLVQYWNGGGNECVLRLDRNVWCWAYWGGGKTMVKQTFSGPVDHIIDDARNSSACAILLDGRLECASYYGVSSTLRAPSRVRVAFTSYYTAFWNDSGILYDYAKPDLTNLLDVSVGLNSDLICAVGSPSSDLNQVLVRCSSSDPQLSTPPTILYQPRLVAAGYGQACMASDTTLSCWGKGWIGTRPPTNIRYPKKLQLASSHGCTLDNFGLLCWGDLVRSGLKIPAGLDSPGRVTDFAVGPNATCAILDDGSLKCWGSAVMPKKVPTISGGTSIAGGLEGGFCATDSNGLHCWGGYTSSLPQ